MKRVVLMIFLTLLLAGCIEQKQSTNEIDNNYSKVKAQLSSPQIISPITGSIFVDGDKVLFDSQIAGGKPPFTYSWTSNTDGLLSRSKSFSIQPSNLTYGDHQIILQVHDSAGNFAQSSVLIKIRPKNATRLSAKIVSPIAGSILSAENEVLFNSQIEGGQPPFSYSWTSNIDGILSTNKSFSLQSSNLSKGSHIIILQVKDASNQSAQGSVPLRVINEASVPQLFIRITSPVTGTILNRENQTLFDSRVEGGQTPFSYKWTSDIDGNLSTNKSFRSDPYSLTKGKHQIVFRANDSSGQSAQSGVSINIVEEIFIPRLYAQIISPISGHILKGKNQIFFDSRVDGGQPPLSYEWTSNINGVLSTNRSFSINPSNLSKGKHNIIFQVNDATGQSTQSSSLVTVV